MGDAFKYLSPGERGILGIAGILFVASTYLFVDDRWAAKLYPEITRKLRDAGTVQEAGPELKRKIWGDFHWARLAAGRALYDGDSLYTGSETTATLQIRTGGPNPGISTLRLEPNTLIVLKRVAGQTELELHQGKARGSLESGQTLVVSSKGSRLELTGAKGEANGAKGQARSELVLSTPAPATGSLELQVRSGNIDLKSGARSLHLGRDQQASLGGQSPEVQLKSFALSANSPGDGELVYKSEDDRVLFSWRAARGSESFQVDAAYDPEFKIQLMSQTVGAGSACAPAQNNALSCSASLVLKGMGVLYWRIQTAQGDSSPVAKFRLLYSSAPGLLFPTVGEVVPAQGIRLQWTDRSQAPAYRVEVARDGSFHDKVFDKALNGLAAELPALEDGTYHWRVRAESGSSPGQWSRPSSFAVQKKLLGDPPNLELPPQGTAVALNAGAASVTLQWSARAGSSQYGVEISARPDFQPLVYAETLTRTSFVWNPTAPGTYFWRVRAFTGEGQATVYSPARSFSILPH